MYLILNLDGKKIGVIGAYSCLQLGSCFPCSFPLQSFLDNALEIVARSGALLFPSTDAALGLGNAISTL